MSSSSDNHTHRSSNISNSSNIDDTASVEDTTKEGNNNNSHFIVYSYNHPQAQGKPVITSIDWSHAPAMSTPEERTAVAKQVFMKGVYWLNKQTLRRELDQFASKTGFTIRTNTQNSFKCNRSGSQRVRSQNGVPRALSSGILQVGCKWSCNIASKEKIIKTYKNRTTKVSDYNTSNIVYITKNNDFLHTNGCEPSIQQQLFTNTASGRYVSNISDHSMFILIGLLKDNPSLNSKTIKTIIQPCFPPSKEVSKSDIFNTKARAFRLMELYTECNNDFEKFSVKFKSSKLSHGI